MRVVSSIRIKKFPGLLLRLGLLAAVSLPASALADTPGFLTGEVLEHICKPLRSFNACPECTCEPITQTNATEEWTAKDTDIVTGTLVKVSGKTADKKVEAYHVVLGTEKVLFDGGRVADLSYPTDRDANVRLEVKRTERHYDMCPGACEHDSVGPVHLFELTIYRDEKTDSERRPERLESHTRNVVACYMYDHKEPVECFVTTLGYESRLFYPSKKRQKPFKGWTRSWGFGGPHGMRFKVGPITGPDARSAKKEAVGKAAKVTEFRKLNERPDTIKATEKGQGVKITIPVSRGPRPVQ